MSRNLGFQMSRNLGCKCPEPVLFKCTGNSAVNESTKTIRFSMIRYSSVCIYSYHSILFDPGFGRNLTTSKQKIMRKNSGFVAFWVLSDKPKRQFPPERPHRSIAWSRRVSTSARSLGSPRGCSRGCPSSRFPGTAVRGVHALRVVLGRVAHSSDRYFSS